MVDQHKILKSHLEIVCLQNEKSMNIKTTYNKDLNFRIWIRLGYNKAFGIRKHARKIANVGWVQMGCKKTNKRLCTWDLGERERNAISEIRSADNGTSVPSMALRSDTRPTVITFTIKSFIKNYGTSHLFESSDGWSSTLNLWILAPKMQIALLTLHCFWFHC